MKQDKNVSKTIKFTKVIANDCTLWKVFGTLLLLAALHEAQPAGI